MLNVMWVSQIVPYPPKGGVLQRSYNLIKQVSRRHKVHLLAFNQGGLLSRGTPLNDAIKHLRDICETVEVVDIPSETRAQGKRLLLARSFFSRKPYTMRWLESEEMTRIVRKIASEREIDIIHCDTISLAIYRNLIPPSVPAVLTHHNVESHMMLRRAQLASNPLVRTYMWLEGIKLQRWERMQCPGFDANIMCSDVDAARLKDSVPDVRTEVVPNGVDTVYFAAEPAIKTPRSLIFAGGMGWYPNRSAMEYFSRDIWPLVTTRYPDARMTLIGRSPPADALTLAKSDSRFIVTGFVDDVRPYFNQSQVYVCPIFDGGGTKLKILDALSMGMPIVAHPVAVEGINVIPEEHLLLASTPGEFAAQVSRLFDDQSLRQRFAVAGRKLAEQEYDFDAIGTKLSSLYSTLNGERR